MLRNYCSLSKFWPCLQKKVQNEDLLEVEDDFLDFLLLPIFEPDVLNNYTKVDQMSVCKAYFNDSRLITVQDEGPRVWSVIANKSCCQSLEKSLGELLKSKLGELS